MTTAHSSTARRHKRRPAYLPRLAMGALGLLACALLLAPPCHAQDFYSIAEENGVWWLRTPAGIPFYSIGVNCVDLGDEARHGANDARYRYQKFYPSVDAWTIDAIARLQSWNFNTIGGWSNAKLSGKGLPDTPVLHLGASANVHWEDPFAADFQTAVDRLVDNLVRPRANDPHLLGWFTDNELGWYPETLFYGYFKYPPENQTRQVLVKMLREHYDANFATLRRDFTPTDADSFDALAKGGLLHLRPGTKGRQIIQDFAAALAARYYRVVHDALRRVDPNHLILGDRYNGHYPIAVAQAAAPYVDLISTNASFADREDGALHPFFLNTLHRATKKPVLISEYYSAAMENQSDNRNASTTAFTTVQTQAERTLVFENTFRSLAALPFMVGAHWFQFYDEPPEGRADGEDFNFGLVDIHNAPYPLLSASMTALQGDILALHAAAQPLRPRDAIAVPEAPSNPFLSLSGWAKAQGYVPYNSELSIGDLYACQDPDFLYLGLRADDYMDPSIYKNGKVPPEDLMTWQFRVSGMDAPVEVRFGQASSFTCNNGAVRVRHFDRGMRQSMIAAIPRALFSPTAEKPVLLKSTVRGYARCPEVQWEAVLQLP